MPIADRHLADDEELVHVTRQHWTLLVGEILLLLIIIAVASALVWVLPLEEQWALWASYLVVGLAFVAAVAFCLVPMLKWWTTVYILTNRRLLYRHGVLARHGRDMPLSRVNDVSFSVSLWERMMGYGTLSVQSASEQDGLLLPKVPRVEWLQSQIYRQVDEEQHRHHQPPQDGPPEER